MAVKKDKGHLLGLIMLSMTAVFWGAGFVLNDQLLGSAFHDAPNLINAVRFGVSAIVLALIFCKKLKFDKKTVLLALAGGAMLFAGFTLQIYGLRSSTPSHNGFFTAAYIVFVPFIAWILLKKRPTWIMFAGVAVALAGLAILNFFNAENDKPTLAGDLLTLTGALMFAAQIVWTDFSLKKGADTVNMTVWQCVFAAVLFILYTVIFESNNYSAISFDASYCVWRLIVTTLGGTAFAYFSQTYAQNRLNATETSLILACESPIGALLSVACGIEAFRWNTLVGGLLVIAAVIMMEIVPEITAKRKQKEPPDESEGEKPDETDDGERSSDGEAADEPEK